MPDRFLREIRDMHHLRKDIRSLPPAKAEEFMKKLGDGAADEWVFRARDAQLPPPDLDWCWLFLGGRGTGKSHSMSAAVHTAVRAGIKRIHFIAPTTTDFHDVNVARIALPRDADTSLIVRGYCPKSMAGHRGYILLGSNLRHHGEEQEYCEDYQVNDALKHGSSAGAQRDHTGEQRQCQQDLVLRLQPELERLADHD